MSERRGETDQTRALLKVFGVKVTDYEDRTRALVERQQKGGLSADEGDALLREFAELTADLHHALRDVTNRVYQLQSDALMQLVGQKPSSA